jgi:hypothetical protein
MRPHVPDALAELYEADETAWLERHADLIRAGRLGDLDAEHLAEYLTDMAGRDRREVRSRLVVLLTDLLKWEFQAERRSKSWLSTILLQQDALRQLLESGTLRRYVLETFPDIYEASRKQAAAQTTMPREAFPEQSPWELDTALEDRWG